MKLWTRISRSFALSLTLFLGLLLVAYGTATAYLSARTLSTHLLDETRIGTVRLVDTVKRSTRYDMMNTRWEDVHRTIENIGQQEGIEHVRIFNKTGKIMYSATPSEIAHRVDLNAEACYQCHSAERPPERLEQEQRSRIFTRKDGHRVLAAIGVIYNEPGCWTAACHIHPESQKVLGVVDIGVSLGETDRRVAAAESRALGIGLSSTLLVCVLIGLFVYRFVNRPVKRLMAGIRGVSEGRFDSSIHVDSANELGHLAHAFNKMTQDLGTARAELRTWADRLEKQVEEKTRDLQIAQTQVVRSEKLSSLGILAAGVAHELNSPLTGILTFAHLLLKKAPEDTQEREDLQLIVNECNRCSSIIRHLLDFSRENPPEKTASNINEIIQRAVSLVEHQALFHDIEIDSRLGPSLLPVEVDFSQMQQVFLNLLVNAAEAMPNGGKVTIHSYSPESTPERLVVEVQDTGSGIPKELINKIFDPFFTSKAVGKGTGLGLAVIYGIVKRHGGLIEVVSTPGAGTTFSVSLPATKPWSAPAAIGF
ncbi:MAG: sensor histidine kinase [Planctomycetota bacterium]